MGDSKKTKAELLTELREVRARLAQLKRAGGDHGTAGRGQREGELWFRQMAGR